VDLLLRLQPDLPGAEERRPQNLDLDLVLDHFLHLPAKVAGEECIQVVCVPEQVGRRQDRPRGNLLRDVLRRDVAELQVVPLERDELGPLLEQRAAKVRFHRVVGFDVLGEALHHVGADVLVREYGGEAQLWFVLRPSGDRLCSGQCNAGLEQGTTANPEIHDFSLMTIATTELARLRGPQHVVANALLWSDASWASLRDRGHGSEGRSGYALQ